MKLPTKLFLLILLCVQFAYSQHNNELYNNGALIRVQPGAEVHVNGDVHMIGASALLDNYGLIRTQGNSYSDNLFQQRGTGTYRIENNTVNVAERQFISGSYAVRGGQAQIGVNDGSFYTLELANDQGVVYLVGNGNIADFRNTVDYNSGAAINRVITHDMGLTGAMVYPLNGSFYSAVFGNMNPNAGLASEIDNTVTTNGNMSAVDNAYVQGKLRRAVNSAGGVYGYVMGLEPAGAGAQRGIQYIHLNLVGANNYDVITGYFETGSSNAGVPTIECSGELMNYFGGVDHGEWMFSDITGSGAGAYEVQIWPQDDNYITAPVWSITKDNSFQGSANQCGPSPVALLRGGYNGFALNPSEFNAAAPLSALPIELIDINAEGIVDHIDVTWNVASETGVSHYELERSEDGQLFEYLATQGAVGTTNISQTYLYHDYDVRYFQNYYYRVRTVDYNGAYSYTPVVVASIVRDDLVFGDDAVSIYPNPSFGDFALSILSEEDLDLTITVYNTLGQLVQEREMAVQSGNTVINVNSEQWAPAVYNIRLEDKISGKVVVKRFVKE